MPAIRATTKRKYSSKSPPADRNRRAALLVPTPAGYGIATFFVYCLDIKDKLCYITNCQTSYFKRSSTVFLCTN